MHATPKPAVAATVAVDLAKDVFELAYADAKGRIVARRRLGRTAFAREFDNHTPLRIVMEACGSAHRWTDQVNLIPVLLGTSDPSFAPWPLAGGAYMSS